MVSFFGSDSKNIGGNYMTKLINRHGEAPSHEQYHDLFVVSFEEAWRNFRCFQLMRVYHDSSIIKIVQQLQKQWSRIWIEESYLLEHIGHTVVYATILFANWISDGSQVILLVLYPAGGNTGNKNASLGQAGMRQCKKLNFKLNLPTRGCFGSRNVEMTKEEDWLIIEGGWMDKESLNL